MCKEAVQRLGDETLNLANMQRGLQSWILARPIARAPSDHKRPPNPSVRDLVFLSPFYRSQNNRLFPCSFPTWLHSSLPWACKGLIQPRLQYNILVNLYVVSSSCQCPNKHIFKHGLFSTAQEWLPTTNSSRAKSRRKRSRNEHHKRRSTKKRLTGVG